LSKSASLPAEPFENPRTETHSWKQEVNQRLAAHRTRRGSAQDEADGRAAESPRAASGRAAEAAARVAARYAKAPSYSELLAGEARAVVRAAGAAAEAARNAQAAAQAVLAGLESGPVASGTWEPAVRRPEAAAIEETSHAATAHVAPARWQDEPPAPAYQPAYEEIREEPRKEAAPRESARVNVQPQPRWQEALPAPSADRDEWSEMRVHPTPAPEQAYRQDGRSDGRRDYRADQFRADQFHSDHQDRYAPVSDDSELFPVDPVASATIEPVQHLPANLIEFPRELVAARKARPRLAEAPFYNAAQESPQLNIFEVDPEMLAVPVYLGEASGPAVAPPEWASIELDHHPEPAYAAAAVEAHAYAHTPAALSSQVEAMPVQDRVNRLDGLAAGLAEKPSEARGSHRKMKPERPAVRANAVELLVAPVSDRLLATVVDGALVTLAFLAAAVVVIASTAHPPAGRMALIATGCGLLLIWLLYQFLFLSYAEEGTPGMRYARIALCTFDDDNPAIEQMRMRIPAMLAAALPAGLGLLWALLDKDRLGLHDRWTRTYQRKY
jgi:uncharacterized RDD family membrane protein YckC